MYGLVCLRPGNLGRPERRELVDEIETLLSGWEFFCVFATLIRFFCVCVCVYAHKSGDDP